MYDGVMTPEYVFVCGDYHDECLGQKKNRFDNALNLKDEEADVL